MSLTVTLMHAPLKRGRKVSATASVCQCTSYGPPRRWNTRPVCSPSSTACYGVAKTSSSDAGCGMNSSVCSFCTSPTVNNEPLFFTCSPRIIGHIDFNEVCPPPPPIFFYFFFFPRFLHNGIRNSTTETQLTKPWSHRLMCSRTHSRKTRVT